MLTEKEYRLLEKEINKLFKAMVIDVRKDIFRRIETAGEMTETAKYQLQSMANIGQLNQDIMNTIIKHNTINEKDIFGIINKYSIKDLKNDNELFLKKGVDKDKLKITDDMREVIRATFKRANNDIKNLTMTTAIGEIDGFLEEVNRLYLETQIGAKTQEQAIRDMKRRYQDKVPYVKYPSGAKRKLPYAMKVILSTSVNQTASELQMKRAEVLETRLMEITAHPDSRPSHTEWQGKIVDLDGKNKKYLTLDDIGYGRGDGFLGFGCRHNWHPYIEGETPVYDKEELKELKEKSIKLAEEKKKEKSDLEEYKRLIKHREHITDLPKNYEKFKELKYNNKAKYDKIKLSQKNINNIKKGIEYFKESTVYELSEIKENVARDLETYKKFKNENIEISNHAVKRYEDRKKNFIFEELVNIIKTKEFNYIQENGRRIKYYNNISIVYEKDVDVIVTLIYRKKRSNKWKMLEN